MSGITPPTRIPAFAGREIHRWRSLGRRVVRQGEGGHPLGEPHARCHQDPQEEEAKEDRQRRGERKEVCARVCIRAACAGRLGGVSLLLPLVRTLPRANQEQMRVSKTVRHTLTISTCAAVRRAHTGKSVS